MTTTATAPQDRPVEEKLLLAKSDGIATITFNNPERHNAVSLEVWQRMDMLLTELAQDPSLRVLIVTGAGGKAFVSGADISKFESERATADAVATYNATSAAAYEKLYHFPRPVIAKIHGYCIGGGCALAVCCDIRVCTDDAKFGIPAAKLGLGYGYAGIKKLSELVGPSRAMELFYTAARFDAAYAHDIGLVNRVVARDEIESHVDELARNIAGNAPMTIATVKAVVREIGKPEAARDLDKLDAMVKACFASQDYVEGRRAFMEKRPPQFQNK
ncbi:MAG: enoyl-CoA hydratase [Pseudomonadota bacterium]